MVTMSGSDVIRQGNIMQTIAIVNEKGGTGKTTTAVNLAAALGEIGKNTLLVDLDGQAATSRWLGVEDDTRLADAILTGSRVEPLKNLLPGVSLAPGCGKLDSVAHDLRPTQGGQLRKILSQLQEEFDYALIDCPPSLSNRMIGNALLAASYAIVPVEPSILALDGLGILLSMLDDVRDGFNHPIELLGVVVCRYDSRTRLSRQVLAELNRVLPNRVFRTVIRETVRMQECPASGKSILAFAPNSDIASDYIALAREVVETLPILNIEENQPQSQLYVKASQEAANCLTIQAFQRMTNDEFRSKHAASNSNTTGVTEDIDPGRECISPSLVANDPSPVPCTAKSGPPVSLLTETSPKSFEDAPETFHPTDSPEIKPASDNLADKIEGDLMSHKSDTVDAPAELPETSPKSSEDAPETFHPTDSPEIKPASDNVADKIEGDLIFHKSDTVDAPAEKTAVVVPSKSNDWRIREDPDAEESTEWDPAGLKIRDKDGLERLNMAAKLGAALIIMAVLITTCLFLLYF